MGTAKAATVRKTITLSRITVRYLETLARKATHGSDWSRVATNFIEEGVRQAIKDGFLTMDEEQKSG